MAYKEGGAGVALVHPLNRQGDMFHTLTSDAAAFIRRNHPYVNSIYADQLLHDLGARSYVAKARILASVEPDHMHGGNRYWATGALIDAFNAVAA